MCGENNAGIKAATHSILLTPQIVKIWPRHVCALETEIIEREREYYTSVFYCYTYYDY